MSDFVILDGDKAIFMPAFGAAIVVVQPGTMRGSGPMTWKGKKVCVDGDEKNVSVPGCMYIAGAYSIPGTGTLKIESLAGDQLTKTTKTGDKTLIIKGMQFNAKFEVQSPAQQPGTPPVPDANISYSGFGQFMMTNMTFRGG